MNEIIKMKYIKIFFIFIISLKLSISKILFSRVLKEEEKSNIITNHKIDDIDLKTEEDIIEQLKLVKIIDKGANDIIKDMKDKIDKLNEKYISLNNTVANLKLPFGDKAKVNNDSNNAYSLRPKLFLCLIIILGIAIYIIELKYEESQDENGQDGINIFNHNKNGTYRNQKSTKLYLSL